jgi:hypothetical protein
MIPLIIENHNQRKGVKNKSFKINLKIFFITDKIMKYLLHNEDVN